MPLDCCSSSSPVPHWLVLIAVVFGLGTVIYGGVRISDWFIDYMGQFLE